MKIEELKRRIDQFNRDTLGRLLGEKEPMCQNPLPSDKASVSMPTDDFPYNCNPCPECFCGRTSKGYTSARSFVDTCLALPLPNGNKCSVAVGAVIDDIEVRSDDDLPVILVVGINYGQGAVYARDSVPLFDKTEMRPKLKSVFRFLSDNGCAAVNIDLDDRFHLVAANFFPWITEHSWSAYKFNSIEEAAIIHCCGHAHPQQYISELVSTSRPTVVVFHGANNAVPYMGSCVIRSIAGKSGYTDFDVVFSDNLAGSFQPAISNALLLCRCTGRAALPYTDYDE